MYLKEIPSETKIRKFIKSILFGSNIFCPECKSRKVVKYETRFRCKLCKCKFSLLSHTWLSNTKISLSVLWTVIWCFTAQIPIKQAAGISGISKKGILYWYQTFRNNLPKEKAMLEAMIQLDEAYFGGFKGRCLLMAKEKGKRKLAYKVLDHDPAREDAIKFIKENIRPNSILCTDGFSIYQGIEKHYLVTHIVDIHKSWEFGKTSEIEGIFGNLRTFIRRMYHHVTPKKLENIVSEFCFRFTHPEMFKNSRIFLQITLCLIPTG